jgi:hypothetical protein
LKVPVLDDNVWPCCVEPETTGGDTTEGETTACGWLEAAATTPDGAEVADAAPFLFEAVTTTLIVAPTSDALNKYDWPVAPPTDAQLPPRESQRCHWYAYVTPTPDHVPGLAVSVCPSCAVPEIVGNDVFEGACLPGRTAAALEIETGTASTNARRTHVILVRCGGVSFMPYGSACSLGVESLDRVNQALIAESP